MLLIMAEGEGFVYLRRWTAPIPPLSYHYHRATRASSSLQYSLRNALLRHEASIIRWWNPSIFQLLHKLFQNSFGRGLYQPDHIILTATDYSNIYQLVNESSASYAVCAQFVCRVSRLYLQVLTSVASLIASVIFPKPLPRNTPHALAILVPGSLSCHLSVPLQPFHFPVLRDPLRVSSIVFSHSAFSPASIASFGNYLTLVNLTVLSSSAY